MHPETANSPPPALAASIAQVKRVYWASIESKFAPGAWTALDTHYREAHRAYHSWRHIAEIFQRFEIFAGRPSRDKVVVAAAFWHDAVFLIQDEDGRQRTDRENVIASAQLFQHFSLFSPDDAEAIHEMIMATTDHLEAAPSREIYPGYCADFDFFLDLDIGSLASPWEQFMQNLVNLRLEQFALSDRAFMEGQIALLTRFAQKERRLYRREESREKWSATAAANIDGCLRLLRSAINADPIAAICPKGATMQSAPLNPSK